MTLFEKAVLFCEVYFSGSMWKRNSFINRALKFLIENKSNELNKVEYEIQRFDGKNFTSFWEEVNCRRYRNLGFARLYYDGFCIEIWVNNLYYSAYGCSGIIWSIKNGTLNTKLYEWENTIPSRKWIYRLEKAQIEYAERKYGSRMFEKYLSAFPPIDYYKTKGMLK